MLLSAGCQRLVGRAVPACLYFNTPAPCITAHTDASERALAQELLTPFFRHSLTLPYAPTFPFADASERALAQELRGIGVGVQEVPEWKQQALGKAPTFGIRDSRSIKDQRESLPIFKLREQLIQAVHDNQVGGESGYWSSGLHA